MVESVIDVSNLPDFVDQELAYATQTTLSVEEAKGIIQALKSKFPDIIGPRKEDICYATTNRQAAAKKIAESVDAMIVIGAPNSSNSVRLVEIARQNGCEKVRLFQTVRDIEWSWLEGTKRLGITAGASAPEVLVEEVIEACRNYFSLTIEEIRTVEENITFHVPKMLM